MKIINNIDDLLNKKEYLNSLNNIYKDLFTLKQQEYFEAYFFDDLSLAEIAENSNVSRNAVFTALKSIEEKLEEYEDKLQILSKKENINKILESSNNLEEIKEKIRNIL